MRVMSVRSAALNRASGAAQAAPPIKAAAATRNPPTRRWRTNAVKGRTRAGHRSIRMVAAVADQHFAAADPVGLADHAGGFHALDDARRAVVADLQVALDKAGRGLAFAGDQGHGLVV